jgi:hypothetical protein
MSVVFLAIYIFLWVLALNGASSMIPLLAVPLVLAVLVAFGVWLNRFMGITPRQQRFEPRRDEAAAPPAAPSAPSASSDGDGDESAAPEAQ